MEENIEATVAGVNAINAPAPKAPKNKGLIAAVIIFAILAIAGIGFGVYGMLNQAEYANNCEADNSTPDKSEATEVPETNLAPSISEVEGILKDKYEFANIQNALSVGIFNHLDNFDESAKIGFIAWILLKDVPGESDPSFTAILKNISYEDINKQYQFYFGNDKDIVKEDITFAGIPIIKMEYNQANDGFIVYFADGLGGVSFTYQLNKVIQVKGSQDKFTATVVTVNLDTMVSQSTDEYLNTSDYGGDKFYDIIMPEETLKEIRESLSAYDFNFIKEGGEYKLISIKKL